MCLLNKAATWIILSKLLALNYYYIYRDNAK